MKILYCKYCKRVVIELQSGSKILKDIIVICKDCYNLESSNYGNFENSETLKNFKNLFGMK